MSENNTPDKAGDYGEELEVPTYRPAAAGAEEVRPSIFERAGRAAPQVIAPRPAPAEPEEPAKLSFASDIAAPDPAAPDTAAPDTAAPATAEGAAAAQGDVEPEGEPLAPPTEQIEVAAAEAEPAPAASSATYLAAETDLSAASEDEELARKAPRGTLDFGLAVLRIGLAAFLILAGLRTIFGWGGSGGLSGLEAEFSAYAVPSVLAIALPAVQLLAGALVLLGLLAPLGMPLAVLATGFGFLHQIAPADAALNPLYWGEGTALAAALLVAALALQFTGPGTISFDAPRSWARRPLVSSWVGCVVALGVLAAAWWFGTGANPVG